MKNINGFDKVVFSELPQDAAFLIEGDTGVLKTTFVLECIKSNSNQEDAVCLYLSLKEDKNLLTQRHSIAPLIESERMKVIDYETLMESIPQPIIKRNIFEGIASLASDFQAKHKGQPFIFVIDPINVVETLINPKDMRRILFHFFSRLTGPGIKNWIIMESYHHIDDTGASLPYHFLADGIISLGMLETADDVIRYLQIIKMRGVHHSLKRFQISYKNEELKILGAVYES